MKGEKHIIGKRIVSVHHLNRDNPFEHVNVVLEDGTELIEVTRIDKSKTVKPIKPLFPPYIGMTTSGEGAMRHTGGGRYYRDAGHWDLTVVKKGRKFVVSHCEGNSRLVGQEFVPISLKAWREDNAGYVPDIWGQIRLRG